jgi:hypothetical protein
MLAFKRTRASSPVIVFHTSPHMRKKKGKGKAGT